MALFTSRIPFQYKCAFSLGKTVIHPDFTTCGLHSSSLPVKPGTCRLHIPPSRISKNNGHKCMFFPTVPKNHRKILGSHRIFLWIGHISLFSLCMPKKHWNFGHSRKKRPPMPRQRNQRPETRDRAEAKENLPKEFHQTPKRAHEKLMFLTRPFLFCTGYFAGFYSSAASSAGASVSRAFMLRLIFLSASLKSTILAVIS